ncbi:MAG: hypothetical protein FWD74_11245, partial [Actinomycetia bacterium]|nr:hypothetical protein [Actinomycetes bacterium]
MSAGLAAHLGYLDGTPSSLLAGVFADVRSENPASPFYTAVGAAAGASADLVWGTRSDTDAVDEWLAAPFHAVGLLRPGLSRVGFARSASGVAAIDVLDGLDAAVAAGGPVLFPGDGSTIGLPGYGGGESPDPTQTCAYADPGSDWSGPGLPLVALLPAAPVAGLSASLAGPGGTATS